MKRYILLLLAALGPCITTLAQTILTPYAFTNFAGQAGGMGNSDGIGTAGRFNNPSDVAVDGAGNLYVADEFNCTIRRMTPAGTNWVVTTLAGSPRNVGSVDATNSVARFNGPSGVATDAGGNIYVADQSSSTIRLVTPQGVVTTLAGSAGAFGSKDGSNSVARFNRPSGLAVDGATNIYVADSGNKIIRKITPIGTNWAVTTIAGTAGLTGNFDGTNGTIRFGVLVNGPASIKVDSATNLYIADIGNSTIRKLTPAGTNWIASTIAGNGSIGFGDGTNGGAHFYNPYGVALDDAGNLYVTDGDNLIRKLTPVGTNWVVTTLAGDTAPFHSADGTGTNAQFYGPEGLSADGAGNIYVADSLNNTIRKITPAAVVTTLASIPAHFGTNDGPAAVARFNLPFGVTLDAASNVYVADQSDYLIRKITPDGLVTTLAGNPDGGSQDGTNANAGFRQPSGIGVDGGGNIYVSDAGNSLIRKVVQIGTNWAVTTIAGGAFGGNDGTNRQTEFSVPYGLAVDANSNLYVADTMNYTIRRITPAGTNWVTTTIAGTKGVFGSNDGTNKVAKFYMPYGIAVDKASNVFVGDYNNMTIRKISPMGTNWVTTTIAGSAGFFGSADGTNSNARFLYPQGIAVDAADNIYVSDGGNCTVRRVSPMGTNWVVTTLGGAARGGDGVGQAGAADGIGSAARLNNIWGEALGPDGNLYIADGGDNRIIKASPLFLFDASATRFTNTDSSIHLRITGPPGTNVVIERTSDMANWTPVQTNVMPPIGANVSLPGTNSAGIFRARLAP